MQGFGAPNIVQESTIDLENLTSHCLEDTRLQYLYESLYLISIPIQLPPWIQKYLAPERIYFLLLFTGRNIQLLKIVLSIIALSLW